MYWGENYLKEYLDTGFELTLFPGDLKHHFVTPSEEEIMGTHVFNGVLSKVYFTMSSEVALTHTVVIS